MRDTRDVLAELAEPAGRVVVDVGCGAGGLVRWLAAQGAEAIGVEPGAEPLRRARERAGHGERYEAGDALALPLADASADVVVFLHSLHHVPAGGLDAALAEAARVLRPGGLVYVQEPLARGPYFELVRPVDDETAVRAAAHAAVRRAAGGRLEHEREVGFDAAVRVAGFEDLRDRVVLVDPARAERFAAAEAQLRERFAATGEPDGDRVCFRQPTRVDLLRRPAGPRAHASADAQPRDAAAGSGAKNGVET